jgi:hypothetical protein
MLNCAEINSFIMNDQNSFWDNDESLFVSGNTPPPQTVTPESDTEMNYQNYLWDDDLEFLNGDDLYVPENMPPSLAATPESPFEMDYRNCLEGNDIDFLGDNLNVSGNIPDWDANLGLLEDNNLDMSQETQDWDTNMELLEENNLYVSGNTLDWRSNRDVSEHIQNWDTNLEFLGDHNLNVSGNTPNLDNDIEFLEDENLSIFENTPPSQRPTEESLLCPILQSSPLIEDLPTPQNIPAEQGGPLPGPLGPLAHEMDYINFIGTGSHRRRLRPEVVPRRKTAKIVAAADSEPYYNDGPRMEEFREPREMWMTRLKNARTVMSIRHKLRCTQLTRRPNEPARKWTNRLDSRRAIMRRADKKHASKMNPSDPAFDSEYRRVFYETKEMRHRNNAAERARVLLIRRNYDVEHGRPRVSTPTPPDDSDDEKFYDHELDYTCKQPSRKEKEPIMASPMVTRPDSGAAGSDTSPTASLAADLDAGNGDLDQLQQAHADSDAEHGDVPRNPFFLRAPAKPDQESSNPSKKKYQRKCVPRDSKGLRLNACAARKLRPGARARPKKDKCAQCLIRRRKCDHVKPTCGNWVKSRYICRPQGSQDYKNKTPQRCRKKVKTVPGTVPQRLAAKPEVGNADLHPDTVFQQAQPAQVHSETGYGDLYQDTSFEQVQTAEGNSDAGYEDLMQNLSFQETQANVETGYGDFYLDTLSQLAPANADAVAGDEDLDMDTWFQQVPAEPEAGCDGLYQDTSFQQTQAEPNAGYEDLHEDPSFQQTQTNSDIGYRVWQNTCSQQIQANSNAIDGASQDPSSQQPPVSPDAENGSSYQQTRLQQARANWVSGYDTRAQAKPDGVPRGPGRPPQGLYPRRQGHRVRKPKPQGDIESMRISRHGLVDGRQIMAQPREDKCILCLANGRRCDRVRPSCGNCRKRGKSCRQQVSQDYLSLYPYNELYSGFPEDVFGAET